MSLWFICAPFFDILLHKVTHLKSFWNLLPNELHNVLRVALTSSSLFRKVYILHINHLSSLVCNFRTTGFPISSISPPPPFHPSLPLHSPIPYSALHPSPLSFPTFSFPPIPFHPLSFHTVSFPHPFPSSVLPYIFISPIPFFPLSSHTFSFPHPFPSIPFHPSLSLLTYLPRLFYWLMISILYWVTG